MAERRRNALTGEWVIVSPDRVKRPWQGTRELPVAVESNRWQEDCYLCPRNTRAHGAINPDYRGTFAFDNDFPALDDTQIVASADPLLQVEPVTGRCRVLCFSERHDATLASLSTAELGGVISLWGEESAHLRRDHAWVQVFENKGAMMGCSSPHPHGQIWATSGVPTIVQREDDHQRHYAGSRSNLLLDYAQRELASAERLVVRNERWLAVVPYWAAWPYETLLLPLKHRPHFDDLDPRDTAELAELLAQLLPAYDRLFDVSFPYSMGWHGRGRDHGAHWQLHAHIYPPLLRSASVRKFMVGFEMLAEAQRDLSAEDAAQQLRKLVSVS
ncbi:MAG: UDP-glucose--hexose-1-phosphate uridylyltransferase [Proteobacteria bacterium]|nr:UDP-glucose--hexose-1-phosphate uridylyltransferase [Pseudomonadota bacterium]